jgi:class 3 adenylate cyclase
LSVLAVLFLLGVFGLTFVRLNFWQHFLLKDMQSLTDACSYRVKSGEAVTAYNKISIPHYRVNLLKDAPPDSLLQYRCTVTPKDKHMAVASFGWILADQATVTLNGQTTYSIHPGSKLTLNVQGATVVDIDIVPRKNSPWFPGFASNHPAVLTYTQAEANVIGGIEILLGLVRALNQILPVFSLIGIISIAWINGVKSRIFLMAIYTLIWVVLQRSLNVVSLLMQGDMLILTKVSGVLIAGYVTANIFFYMETFRVKPKAIYPLARLHCGMVLLGVAVAPFFATMRPDVLTLIKMSVVPLLVVIATAAFRKGALGRADTRRYFFVAVAAILCFALDGVTRTGIASDFSEVFLPILMAISLILDFTGAEKRYQEQRLRSEDLKIQVSQAQAATGVLGRFLPEALVQQLATSNTAEIDRSLARILSPSDSQVALIQADIRGFTRFLESHDSVEVSHVLRKIFEPAVNTAQKTGMVKLIGDCLFAFIEEKEGENAVDGVVEIARSLIRSMEELYRENDDYRCLRFGIGVNYGRVLLGNLSSSTCIDYTVLGPAVNLVARLEETTKLEAVSSVVGPNGVVIGPDALMRLSEELKSQLQILNGIQIRSFPDIRVIGGLTAEALTGQVRSPLQYAA